MNKKLLHKIAFILLVIGGLNFLAGAFDQDVIGRVFDGLGLTVAQVLIGLSALYEIFTHKGNCTQCSA